MNSLEFLMAVRKHLLDRQVASCIHLALPPKITYPLILIELEEVWSPCPSGGSWKGGDIQTRIKFKVTVYSHGPGMEEAACLSDAVRKVLEGATLCFSGKTSTVRFLACVAETLGKACQNPQARAICHFYDGIVRGNTP